MPKKDPFTGVSVLTTAEFWQKEAEHEGKGRQGFELMQEMHEQIEDDCRQEEDRIRQDPNGAMEAIKEYFSAFENELDGLYEMGFTFAEILSIEMLDAKVDYRFGESESGFTAKLTLVDQTTRTVQFTSWHTSGLYYEPPDGEDVLIVIAINDNPVIYRYNDVCAHRHQWDNEAKQRLPMCEVCDHFGGGAVDGRLNAARYLCPASSDQGKTVDRWVRVCVAHVRNWYKNSGWLGPVVELKQVSPSLGDYNE